MGPSARSSSKPSTPSSGRLAQPAWSSVRSLLPTGHFWKRSPRPGSKRTRQRCSGKAHWRRKPSTSPSNGPSPRRGSTGSSQMNSSAQPYAEPTTPSGSSSSPHSTRWKAMTSTAVINRLGKGTAALATAAEDAAFLVQNAEPDSPHLTVAIRFWTLLLDTGRSKIPAQAPTGLGRWAFVANIDDGQWADLTARTLDATGGRIDYRISVADRAARLPPSSTSHGILLRLLDNGEPVGTPPRRHQSPGRAPRLHRPTRRRQLPAPANPPHRPRTPRSHHHQSTRHNRISDLRFTAGAAPQAAA